MFINCPHCQALVATDPASDLPPERCPRCSEQLRRAASDGSTSGSVASPAVPEHDATGKPTPLAAAEQDQDTRPASAAAPEPQPEPGSAAPVAATPAAGNSDDVVAKPPAPGTGLMGAIARFLKPGKPTEPQAEAGVATETPATSSDAQPESAQLQSSEDADPGATPVEPAPVPAESPQMPVLDTDTKPEPEQLAAGSNDAADDTPPAPPPLKGMRAAIAKLLKPKASAAPADTESPIREQHVQPPVGDIDAGTGSDTTGNAATSAGDDAGIPTQVDVAGLPPTETEADPGKDSERTAAEPDEDKTAPAPGLEEAEPVPAPDATAPSVPESAPAPATPTLVAVAPAKPAPSFAHGGAGSRSGTGWKIPATIAGLALLLVLQLLLSDRAQLAADARWRPWLTTLCGALHCSLPPWREPSAFVLLARDVRPHPSRSGALRVTATFRNDARWPQPWPRLRLTLSDIDGRPVAARDFSAREYLDVVPTQDELASGQSATIAMDVLEPAAHSVAFDFELH